jgi:hypothetical protein
MGQNLASPSKPAQPAPSFSFHVPRWPARFSRTSVVILSILNEKNDFCISVLCAHDFLLIPCCQTRSLRSIPAHMLTQRARGSVRLPDWIFPSCLSLFSAASRSTPANRFRSTFFFVIVSSGARARASALFRFPQLLLL